MKVTIENINGAAHTVVLHSEGQKDAVLLQCKGIYGYYENYYHKCGAKSLRHIATALPALPKHPKPQDARLLYRYMAEGIDLRFLMPKAEIMPADGWEFADIVNHIRCCDLEITHAINSKTGDRVEVAINENHD